MAEKHEGASHGKHEEPKKKLENTAESIRSELNGGKKIDLTNPVNAMKVNIAWAKRNPDHPLSKKIQGLENYEDLQTNQDAAKKAIGEMKKIQATLGIAAGDGIIGPGTLKTFETKDKDKEQRDAQNLIDQLDQSLYTPDLQKKTEQARKEKPGFLSSVGKAGKSVLSGKFQAGLKEVKKPFEDTKVTDAKGNEYKVGKSAEGKPQYTNKDGEVFEINADKKLVSIKKVAEEQKATMTALIERAKSETTGFTAGNPLQEGSQLSPYYNEKGEVVSIQNEKGEVYNLGIGKFETVQKLNEPSTQQTHQIVTNALKEGEGKKYKEGNDKGFFEVNKDENGQLIAFRSKGLSARDEYYNIDKKTWEPYTDGVKKDRKEAYLASLTLSDKLDNIKTSLPLVKGMKWDEKPIVFGDAEHIDINNEKVDSATRETILEMKSMLKKYPNLGSLSLDQFKKYQNNPDAFILDSDTDQNPLFRQKNGQATEYIKGKDLDLSKELGINTQGATYKKEGDIWTKKVPSEKLPKIAKNGAFISAVDYIRMTEGQATNGVKKLPGTNLSYSVELSGNTKILRIGEENTDNLGTLKEQDMLVYENGKKVEKSKV